MSTALLITGMVNDLPGDRPRDDIAQHERPEYERIRLEYSRAIQAANVIPVYPQAPGKTPQDYERELLDLLAPRTERYSRLDCSTIDDDQLARYRERITADAERAPYRDNVLREIKTTDEAGREIREFIGPKSEWLRPFMLQPARGQFVIDGVPRRAYPGGWS